MAKAMSAKRAVAMLSSKGWTIVRTRGSHTVWESPTGARFTLPDGHREISPGVARNLMKALEETNDKF
jgi:predicted RNA binding protein YcfA (HicA-like mRNA interferase family)